MLSAFERSPKVHVAFDDDDDDADKNDDDDDDDDATSTKTSIRTKKRNILNYF